MVFGTEEAITVEEWGGYTVAAEGVMEAIGWELTKAIFIVNCDECESKE
jgi:hypothetical protein